VDNPGKNPSAPGKVVRIFADEGREPTFNVR
jgi:hypothetical protein